MEKLALEVLCSLQHLLKRQVPPCLSDPLPRPLPPFQVSVEELALEFYASKAGGGWQGMHTEGGVWATLFGLLM